jgi:hypothetical protein
MTRIGYIDGDSFLYRAGFSVEKTKYLVEIAEDEFLRVPNGVETKNYVGCPVWTRREIGTVEEAKGRLDEMLADAVAGASVNHHFVYLSPISGNFRDALGTIRKYKGNRDTSSRPVYYADLREHLLHHWSATIARGEEADDMISWVSRQRKQNNGDEPVIVGIDKDLFQIPGEHYDWVTKERKQFTEDESRIWMWMQVLAGDSGDNIVGCWKVGYEKARKFLAQNQAVPGHALWPKICKLFADSQKAAGCPYSGVDPEAAALETTRLIRLRHVMDEPLWVPEKENGESAKNATEQETQ